MSELEEIKKELQIIKERNNRVEVDKTWETSFSRKILISILTYTVIVIFLFINDFPKPFLNPIVPTIGFILSTLTVPFFKKIWVNKILKNSK
ncbi:MAG: hypothetical protein WCV55_00200 [Candidatus Paceibacterota bacterium]